MALTIRTRFFQKLDSNKKRFVRPTVFSEYSNVYDFMSLEKASCINKFIFSVEILQDFVHLGSNEKVNVTILQAKRTNASVNSAWHKNKKNIKNLIRQFFYIFF